MDNLRQAAKVLAHVAGCYSPPFTVVGREILPEEFTALREQWRNSAPFPVSSLFSDTSVFAHKKDNLRFRAWHDGCHFKANAPFTPEGERAAFNVQLVELSEGVNYSRYVLGVGQLDPVRAFTVALLECEVLGQLEYEQKHGHFPIDQVAFTVDWLTSRGFTV